MGRVMRFCQGIPYARGRRGDTDYRTDAPLRNLLINSTVYVSGKRPRMLGVRDGDGRTGWEREREEEKGVGVGGWPKS